MAWLNFPRHRRRWKTWLVYFICLALPGLFYLYIPIRAEWLIATYTRQAPMFAEEGKEGESRWLILELKLLADVGLVGLPNSGKSTLISSISSARPKVADYPFTTLTPQLGVVSWGDFKSFVVADIPGLIEGASAGKGLGYPFLRHIERTRLLLHLVDISEAVEGDPVDDLNAVRRELSLYSPKVGEKPFAVVATKTDIKESGEKLKKLENHCHVQDFPFFAVSAADGSFQIRGLPPGEYTLVAMQERLGHQKATVTVGPGESKGIEILYKQPER
jgi:GTP-binding protein